MSEGERSWTVRAGLGLFWIHGGQLYELCTLGEHPPRPFPAVPRPARDVLRALLTYAVEQLDRQVDPLPELDFEKDLRE